MCSNKSLWPGWLKALRQKASTCHPVVHGGKTGCEWTAEASAGAVTAQPPCVHRGSEKKTCAGQGWATQRCPNCKF